MPALPELTWIGEASVLLDYGGEPGPESTARVSALLSAMEAARLPEVAALTPGFTSLLVELDPPDGPQRIEQRLLEIARSLPEAAPQTGRLHVVPVVFGGEHGPDLVAVASRAGLTTEDVVRLFLARDYQVYLMGFAPGFPYLGDVPRELRQSRLATPRERVSAGSVAIAGSLAGIYPSAGPGGWRLIGQTPRTLFNPRRDPPTYLRPGDRVRFAAILEDHQEAFGGAAPDW